MGWKLKKTTKYYGKFPINFGVNDMSYNQECDFLSYRIIVKASSV